MSFFGNKKKERKVSIINLSAIIPMFLLCPASESIVCCTFVTYLFHIVQLSVVLAPFPIGL